MNKLYATLLFYMVCLSVRYTYVAISYIWCVHNIVHTMLYGGTVSTCHIIQIIVPITMILKSLNSTLPLDRIFLYEVALPPRYSFTICSKLNLVRPFVKKSALCSFISTKILNFRTNHQSEPMVLDAYMFCP